MIKPLGESFAPTSAADEEGRKPNPAQTAIQVLSMRLPRIKGARSISPLVGEPGSAARREAPGGFSPDSAVLQTLMRAQAPTGTSDAMSAPMGSMPGASSAGASNPMSAAMAALGGGMMNAAPSAPYSPGPPVITPGIADPRNPPPIVPGPPPMPASVPAPAPREPREPMPGPSPRIPQGEPDETRERDRWPAPAPIPSSPGDVSYGGQSPVDPNGNPNPDYNGNTGIRPPRIPMPSPPIDIPVPTLPNGGPPTAGEIDPRLLRALMRITGSEAV